MRFLLIAAAVSAAVAALYVITTSTSTEPAAETTAAAVITSASSFLSPYTTAPATQTSADTSAPATAAQTTSTTTPSQTTPAMTSTSQTTAAVTEPPGIRFTHPELASSSQLLLVTVDSGQTTYTDIVYYEKNGEAWKEIFKTEGRVAKKGITPEEERVQDDDKTPAGIHKIIGAFGTNPDPGALFEYITVTDDMYWDLNSGSATYNRLVYGDPGGKRERLILYGTVYVTYRYALITDYNYEQAAGKGGAIFIHCTGIDATAGCVSMPENLMKTLLTRMDPAKNPAVVITLKSRLSDYTG